MSQPRPARGDGSGRGLVAEILDVPYSLITGASSGIGGASGFELTSEFSHVTTIGRDPARHDEVLGRPRKQSTDASLVECDLTSRDAAVRVRTETTSRGIDALIADAGVAGSRGIIRDGFKLHSA